MQIKPIPALFTRYFFYQIFSKPCNISGKGTSQVRKKTIVVGCPLQQQKEVFVSGKPVRDHVLVVSLSSPMDGGVIWVIERKTLFILHPCGETVRRTSAQ